MGKQTELSQGKMKEVGHMYRLWILRHLTLEVMKPLSLDTPFLLQLTTTFLGEWCANGIDDIYFKKEIEYI